jgi:hypothetical protein
LTSAHGLDPMEDTNKETAKAIQEVAKSTSDAIRMAERFGGFLGRVFGPAIEDIGEMAHLKTQYWKLRNAVRFQNAVERLL